MERERVKTTMKRMHFLHCTKRILKISEHFSYRIRMKDADPDPGDKKPEVKPVPELRKSKRTDLKKYKTCF